MTRSTLLRSTTLIVLGALALAGCSSAPPKIALLEEARTEYRAAATNASIAGSAPLELRRAEQAIVRADRLIAEGAPMEELNHQAYVAKQRVGIVRETARAAAAEASVRNSNDQRDKVLIEARSREADSARKIAETRAKEAEDRLRQLELARAEASKASEEASRAQKRAQELEAQLKARQTERGLVLTLGDVLFDTGKSALKPGAYRTIDQLSAFLREYPKRTVRIEGFTDSVGSEEFNLLLSEDRARSVQVALLQRGIVSNRIIAQGFGESFPVASNDTPGGRQQNRRVEIVISDDAGKIVPRTR